MYREKASASFLVYVVFGKFSSFTSILGCPMFLFCFINPHGERETAT